MWTVDDVASLVEIKKKEFLFIYLFLPSVAHDPAERERLDRTKIHKTLLYSIDLVIT